MQKRKHTHIKPQLVTRYLLPQRRGAKTHPNGNGGLAAVFVGMLGLLLLPVAVRASENGAVRSVTQSRFTQEISEGVVLVDFWAPWCGPCRRQSPVLEDLARRFAGDAKIVKVNTDENRRLASQYKVEALPTLMLFVDGKVVDRFEGLQDKMNLSAELNNAVRASREKTSLMIAARGTPMPSRSASYPVSPHSISPTQSPGQFVGQSPWTAPGITNEMPQGQTIQARYNVPVANMNALHPNVANDPASSARDSWASRPAADALSYPQGNRSDSQGSIAYATGNPGGSFFHAPVAEPAHAAPAYTTAPQPVETGRGDKKKGWWKLPSLPSLPKIDLPRLF